MSDSRLPWRARDWLHVAGVFDAGRGGGGGERGRGGSWLQPHVFPKSWLHQHLGREGGERGGKVSM